jgi:hypothetical protein
VIKTILLFVATLFILAFALDTFAQSPIIVLDPDGNVKSIVILPLPPPTWR